jgi:hypothetical protein
LGAVHCLAASSCVEVGGYLTSASPDHRPLVETLSGGTWKQSTPPSIAGGDVHLTGVGCSSPAHCLAVGSANAIAEAGPDPWIASAPSGSEKALLDGAACASATTCTGVGDEGAAGWLLTDVSGTWSSVFAPAPVGTVADELAGVSCPASALCTAVGRGVTSVGPTGFGDSQPEVVVLSGLST